VAGRRLAFGLVGHAFITGIRRGVDQLLATGLYFPSDVAREACFEL
jgi:hypothetical protein